MTFLIKSFFKILLTLFVATTLLSSSLFAKEPTQQERNEMAAKLIPIITMLLMDGDSTPPAKPSLTTPVPAVASSGTLEVEVNGEAGSKVYVDGVQIGTVGANGKTTIQLTFVNGTNDMTIILKDQAGNESEGLSFSVSYDAPPVITLVGDNPMTITQGTTYIEQGATALDDTDGVLSVITTGTVDTDMVDIYTVTYRATDTVGNIGEANRTVHVILPPDAIAPVITIVGDNLMTIPRGTVYIEQGATALDDVDGNISVVITGYVDTSIIGTYIISYTAVDSAGNESSMIRTIIISDNAVPILTLVGPNIITVFKNSIYTDPGATAYDDNDGNITNDIIVTNNVDTSVIGDYNISFSVSNTNGNTDVKNRSIHVVELNTIKTGQTKSYDVDHYEVIDGHIKDDGYYQKGIEPIYTRDNVNGILTNHLTGIMWQDTQIVTKRWVTIVNFNNGNYSDTSGDTAATYCEELTLGGYNDWKLPTIYELFDVREEYFLNSTPTGQSYQEKSMWTQNEITKNSDAEWTILQNEIFTSHAKKTRVGVRCIRNRFDNTGIFVRDNIEKVVVDTKRHLMWQDDDAAANTKIDWESSLSYCENLNLAGFDDWRMPNIHEFETIVDKNRINPAVDVSFQSGYLGFYWSSTTISYTSAINALLGGGVGYAYVFHMGIGSIGSYNTPNSLSDSYKDGLFNVRCLRDVLP